MFYDVLGDFLNNPLSSSSNSIWQKHLFLVFLTLQELRDSKKGKVRDHASKIWRRTNWDELGHQEIKDMGNRTGGSDTSQTYL
jgi:hypothetical protein